MHRSMEPTEFLKGRTRESTIRRDALGRWFHDGEPIEHPLITRAFDRWVSRADDGRYCLKNEVDWAYVAIEGPPLFVRSLRVEALGRIYLRLSDEQEQELDPSTLRQDQDGALYCDARRGTMAARFDRHAMARLQELIEEDEKGVYLKLGENRVRPPLVADPLRPGSAAPHFQQKRAEAS